MFVGSGKVPAGSGVLSDMAQCQQLPSERFLGCMAKQGDDEQGSLGRELSGDEQTVRAVARLPLEVLHQVREPLAG